jgi:hypothetical protein
MTDAQITHAFSEAPNYPDPDAFVSDLLLSAVFLPPDDPAGQPDLTLAEPLRRIWQAACLPVKPLLAELGLTQTGLSRRYGIPLRTVQDWAGERRTPPLWLRLILADLAGWLEREP